MQIEQDQTVLRYNGEPKNLFHGRIITSSTAGVHSRSSAETWIRLFAKRLHSIQSRFRQVLDWFRQVADWFRQVPNWFRQIPDWFRQVPDWFRQVPDWFREVPVWRHQVPVRVWKASVRVRNIWRWLLLAGGGECGHPIRCNAQGKTRGRDSFYLKKLDGFSCLFCLRYD
jgi:hypothetical protein